jgi:hypothetical protein
MLRTGRSRKGDSSASGVHPARACRFYHWGDRSSLKAAVAIARRHDVALERIRSWSEAEGAPDRFEEFLRLVKTERLRPQRRK